MYKRYFVIFIILILTFIGFSGCIGSRYTEYFNDEYEVNENTILKVSTINGQIEILGWDEDSWDNDGDAPDTEDMYWDELTPEQQAAAVQLCYFR